ncbi:MAG: hypothetical protein HC923_01090 [Myxococcales bacterium]|nr:hypothetical protein [Myxococcales bacterium]
MSMRGRVTLDELKWLSDRVADQSYVVVGEPRFLALMAWANKNARTHGFWDEDHGNHTNIAKLGLHHAEVSEVVEACRFVENPLDLGSMSAPPRDAERSEKIPEFTQTEEELADTVIRAMDFAQERKCRLLAAIVAKLAFNETREHMHGKKVG